MASERSSRLTITLTAAQVAMIDTFQQKESVPTRAKAVELLLDIALETVTSQGRRFWDKPIARREE